MGAEWARHAMCEWAFTGELGIAQRCQVKQVLILRSLRTVIVMLTWPPTGRTRSRGSIAGGVTRVFSSLKLPDHI